MTVRSCRDLARWLGAYADGELEPAQALEIGGHIAECETCREELQLLRAMRGSLKRVVRTRAADGLQARIATAMMAEQAREGTRVGAEDDAFPNLEAVREISTRPTASSSWRTMVPLASAAALALLWGAATRGPSATSREMHAGFGDDLLAELVAEHSQPLPPEATDSKSVRGLERYVGVPVHPGSFERAGAHLVGGRVVPLRAQRTLMLQYVVGNGDDARRVSILVYDAQKIQIGSATTLAPRAVGTAQVQVGTSKGYSVVATQREGVGYLLASDLDQDKSAQLAAMVYDDR
jgi:anti-sigma factor RsiW